MDKEFIQRAMAMAQSEKAVTQAIHDNPSLFTMYESNYDIACKEKLIIAAYHEILKGKKCYLPF